MLKLIDDELGILCSAISWTQYVRHPREPAPKVSLNDWQQLRIFWNEMISQRRSYEIEEKPVCLAIRSSYSCDYGEMSFTMQQFQLLRDTLANFLKLLEDSPKEIEAVSGYAVPEQKKLLSRLDDAITSFLENKENAKRLTWFSAKILYETIKRGADHQPLLEISIHIIKGYSIEEVTKEAEVIGKGNECCYQNDLNEFVQWKFVKVLEVQELCLEELNNGDEVFSTMNWKNQTTEDG